jgi:hypothetical protein
MYTWNNWSDSDQRKPHWEEHRITKITKKRIFVADEGDRQYSFDRAKAEAEGSAFFRDGTANRRFYSEAGKVAQEAKWAQFRKDNLRAILGDHCALLGLSDGFTRADVMRAFRQQAQIHHPDKGGDPVIFRHLVMAKERALALAEAELR